MEVKSTPVEDDLTPPPDEMVKIIMNCKNEVKKIDIDPSIVKTDEKEITSLGISIGKTKNNEGVIVTKIYNDDSKLILEDIITEINREKISNPTSFKTLLYKIQKTGRSSLLLKIIRDQESLWITIKFKDN